MATIGVGILWFGPALPPWIQAFVERCTHSSSIQIIGIGEVQGLPPPAIQYLISRSEFYRYAGSVLGFPVVKEDKAHGELRCALPTLFPHLFDPFPWWGWAEFDTVWGDWDSYLTPALLEQWDVISSSERIINGCWTILRNTPDIRSLWRFGIDKLRRPEYTMMDEDALSDILRGTTLRVLYPSDPPIVSGTGPARRAACRLVDNHLYEVDAITGATRREIMLYHFPLCPKAWPLS